jgi:hypothetical protein
LEKTAGKMGGAVALAVQRARCIRRRSVAGESLRTKMRAQDRRRPGVRI